ncbi:MAG: hypothetical protein VX093_01415 [Pseudomonadota bacterium]|nr:hypothetical protein [Pseudomonadota bacterium]
MFKKLIVASYFAFCVLNTSFAGGESDSTPSPLSNYDLYGTYTLSLGQLDWNKNSSSSPTEPMQYQPFSIEGWVGKKLTQDTEGILRTKLTLYDRTGNIMQAEDDAVKKALTLNLMHLRHYDSSTSFINLGFIYSEEIETSIPNVDANSYILSTGLATESMVLEFGIGSTNKENRSYYVDELVYYNFSYKLPVSDRINLIAAKHYSEYERKLTADIDGEDMDISGLKVTYDLENSFITFGGDRYTVKNGPGPENTGGSVYFSWTVPIGKSASSRTNFILDNRPAVDKVIGFGAALN